MTGGFSIEWLDGGVLLQRRTGMFTVEEAQEYVEAVKAAVASAPSPWGAVVDTRSAGVQTENVQEIIQGLIQYVVSQRVKRVAIVSTSVVTGLQQRRVTTSPGMHDPSTVDFYTDYDAALADVRAALASV
jgi:hypothetical protein